MKQTVYIETSVVSYLTSRPSRDLVVAAHQQITREWWDSRLPEYDAFISEAVIAEASRGDEGAAALRLASIADMDELEIGPEVVELAERYFRELKLPGKAKVDAYHMAVASWHGVDFVASWNCSHIACGRTQLQLSAINDAVGIASPILCTPEEL